MKLSSNEIRELWQSIFLRKGKISERTILSGQSHSVAFDEASWLKLDNESGELPVLTSRLTEESHWVLTTNRMIGKDWSVNNDEVFWVKVPRVGGVKKEESAAIEVVLKNNKSLILPVESGKPFLGVLNVLLNLSERNKE